MGQQPSEPGWYNDPSGVYDHQEYWDGENWTGDTRPGTPKVNRKVIAVAAIVGVIGFVVAYLVLIELAARVGGLYR